MTSLEERIAKCEQEWADMGIEADSIAEMREELRRHLEVDPDASPEATLLSIRASHARKGLRTSALGTVGVTAVSAVASLFDSEISSNTILILSAIAMAMFVGEVLTGGYFLLPFAVAATLVTCLALIGAGPVNLIITGSVLAVILSMGLRAYAAKDDDVVIPVGGNRFVNRIATVTIAVPGPDSVGEVTLDGQRWRAIVELPQSLDVGDRVRVLEVRGTRLVVAP